MHRAESFLELDLKPLRTTYRADGPRHEGALSDRGIEAGETQRGIIYRFRFPWQQVIRAVASRNGQRLLSG